MLQIALPLAATNSLQPGTQSALSPLAVLTMEDKSGERCINITLKGVICGNSADTLLQFLQGASALVGNQWNLQMSELLVLSGRGMKSLTGFARHIRRRGYEVKVQGINQNLYSTMKELNLERAFAWAD